MIRSITLALATLTAAVAAPRAAEAHCQVPCGIYDDHARVHTIREHITTIEKATQQIDELAGKKDAQSKNQLVRWIDNKEEHAEKIIRIVSDYFLTQKIEPSSPKDEKAYAKYVQMVTRHHAVMVAAMKCKQNVSMDEVASLKKAVDAIAGYWPEK